MRTEYEAKAREIARSLGLKVKATRHPDGACPRWGKTPCDHIHGNHYKVRLSLGRRSLSFDYWNSWSDARAMKAPGYYDVLACISSDYSIPIDPDEVVREFGEMPPSQAIAAARFAQRLQRFFTEEQAQALSEIQ